MPSLRQMLRGDATTRIFNVDPLLGVRTAGANGDSVCQISETLPYRHDEKYPIEGGLIP